MVDGDITRIVSNKSAIVGLYNASSTQQLRNSEGKCNCGFRVVTTTPTHNVLVGPTDLISKTFSGDAGSTKDYIEYLWANESKILDIFGSISTAREMKGAGKTYFKRFILNDDLGNPINTQYSAQELIDLL